MQLTEQIKTLVINAIEAAQQAEALPAFEVPSFDIERPRDTTHGDYASPIALRLTKLAKMPPRKIAETIMAHFDAPDFIEALSIAGPGFINFKLSSGFVQGLVETMIADGMNFGRTSTHANKKAQVECVSANPTGPITIGRTRGGVIGDTLARLMRSAGYDVELEYYYNDAGRQIEMLGQSAKIRYLQQLGESIEFDLGADAEELDAENHYQGGYLIDIAKEIVAKHGDSVKDEPTQWFADFATNIISSEQKKSLHSIGVHHDTWFNEANLYTDGRLGSTLEQLDTNGYIYQKDGAWWLKTTEFGDDKDRVAVRSDENDGRPTYRMGDIVYHKDKADRGFDVVVDIFGPDHHGVAPQVLMGVQMLGYDTSFVNTLLHQIVTLIRDGKQVKMSTRRGNYVTLDELVDEVGPDPVRYFMISRSANSHINFDLDVAVERSDKNPVFYIQNAHVRCAGIFRKWEAAGHAADADLNADLSLLTNPLELAFLTKALELSEIIDLSVNAFEPHHIAFYAYDLAATFHPMYDQARVIHTEVSPELAAARLRLYRAAKSVFARVLDLMGMSAPEQM